MPLFCHFSWREWMLVIPFKFFYLLKSLPIFVFSISFLSLSIALMELFNTNFNRLPFFLRLHDIGGRVVSNSLCQRGHLLCACWTKARLALLDEIVWFTPVTLNLHEHVYTKVQFQLRESSLEDGNTPWLSQSVGCSNCPLGTTRPIPHCTDHLSALWQLQLLRMARKIFMVKTG